MSCLGTTTIKSYRGNVPLNSITVGDMVLTTEGYQPVTDVIKRHHLLLFRYLIGTGMQQTELIGTSTHKVRTIGGAVKLCGLVEGMSIYGEARAKMVTSCVSEAYGYCAGYDLCFNSTRDYLANGIMVASA
jgi:hypothetical protein